MRKTITTLILTGALLGAVPVVPANAAPDLFPGCHSFVWGEISAKRWMWYLYNGWHGYRADDQERLYSPGCFV